MGNSGPQEPPAMKPLINESATPMKLNGDKTSLPLSLRAIGEWEKRVLAQRRLIAALRMKGRPTKGAEADLMKYQAFLAQLRNHRETMASLMGPTTGHSI
jgi:hypothetical protein